MKKNRIKKKYFKKLEFNDQLLYVLQYAKELDSFMTWFGEERIIAIYALENYFVAMTFDLATENYIKIKAFKNFNYLNRYPEYVYMIERKTNDLLL